MQQHSYDSPTVVVSDIVLKLYFSGTTKKKKALQWHQHPLQKHLQELRFQYNNGNTLKNRQTERRSASHNLLLDPPNNPIRLAQKKKKSRPHRPPPATRAKKSVVTFSTLESLPPTTAPPLPPRTNHSNDRASFDSPKLLLLSLPLRLIPEAVPSSLPV